MVNTLYSSTTPLPGACNNENFISLLPSYTCVISDILYYDFCTNTHESADAHVMELAAGYHASNGLRRDPQRCRRLGYRHQGSNGRSGARRACVDRMR